MLVWSQGECTGLKSILGTPSCVAVKPGSSVMGLPRRVYGKRKED